MTRQHPQRPSTRLSLDGHSSSRRGCSLCTDGKLRLRGGEKQPRLHREEGGSTARAGGRQVTGPYTHAQPRTPILSRASI